MTTRKEALDKALGAARDALAKGYDVRIDTHDFRCTRCGERLERPDNEWCTCAQPELVFKEADGTFAERKGCLICDKWLGPPVLLPKEGE
jgi:hypothetical protein